MKDRKVVVTGLGVVAPTGTGVADFEAGLRSGRSGIRYHPDLKALNFSCCIAGQPELHEDDLEAAFTPLERQQEFSNGLAFGILAGLQAWQDAGLRPAAAGAESEPDWDSGVIFGNGSSAVTRFREAIYKIDAGDTRRLGSTSVGQTMVSNVSAWLGGKLGLGNQVTTNASACATGTESILMAYQRIRSGEAERMLAGSTSDGGPYIWAGFDAMRVCTYKHNMDPGRGSRPLSATASGFVPGAGAGALVLESLDSARKRGAPVYAELAGGHINSGGQRGGGSMTAPNPEAVQRCIKSAMNAAGIAPESIDVLNGHLTATGKDVVELQNWWQALQVEKTRFPFVQALKSHIGHCLSAAGSIEAVAAVLQLSRGFLFPNLNSEDLHPEVEKLIGREKVPRVLEERPIGAIAKLSLGFGDVNACLIFKKL